MTARALLLALLLAPAGPAAASDAVTLSVTPPPAKPRLAEPFKFRVDAALPEKYSIRPDTAAAGNAEFEILSFRLTGEELGGGVRHETYEVEAKPFTLGVSTFPALPWTLTRPGAGPETVRASSFTVEVLPVFEKTEGQDIRDIYQPYGYFPWLLTLLLAALAALLGAYLYKRLNAGRPGGVFSGAPWYDARDPYRRALDRLKLLHASPLLEAGKFKQYYTGLTAILRLYLEEEFNIDSGTLTTADLSRELKRTGAELSALIRTRELLQKADLVKFARHTPASPGDDKAALEALLGEYRRAAEAERARKAAAEAAAAEAARRRGGRP